MSYSVTLTTEGPCDPLYVLEVAEAIAEAVKVLNHLTRHHEALGEPSDADRVIRELSSAVARLPQLTSQIAAWIRTEHAAGTITLAGDYENPDASILAAAYFLEKPAAMMAGLLQAEFDNASAITSDMEVQDGSDT